MRFGTREGGLGAFSMCTRRPFAQAQPRLDGRDDEYFGHGKADRPTWELEKAGEDRVGVAALLFVRPSQIVSPFHAQEAAKVAIVGRSGEINLLSSGLV